MYCFIFIIKTKDNFSTMVFPHPWSDFAPQRTSSNVWRHFWLLYWREAISIQWAEARDTAKHSTTNKAIHYNQMSTVPRRNPVLAMYKQQQNPEQWWPTY